MTSSVDLAEFDLFDPLIQQAPHEWYERMREAGVVHVPANDVYLVTTYELALEVVRDPETFSSKWGTNREPPPPEVAEEHAKIVAEGIQTVPTLLDNDPPDHARYRKLVSPAFTPRKVNKFRPAIEQVCDELIDGWIDRGGIEFVGEFAVPLPVRVIAKVLNVPEERQEDFKRWSDDNIAAIGAKLSPEEYLRTQRGIVEMQQFFIAEFEARRTEPRGDLFSELVSGDLEMPELVRLVQALLVAGNETTTKFLTETVRHLAEQPGSWQALRDEPERIPGVVEEGLRLASPTQGMYRLATKDTEVGGVPIPAGAKLVVMFASANRDDSLFPDPDAFEPGRENVREHLAFGRGTHFCVGAALSRLEGNVAFERLTGRLPDVRLAPGNRFEYQPSFMLRGLKQLHIEFDPA